MVEIVIYSSAHSPQSLLEANQTEVDEVYIQSDFQVDPVGLH